MTDPITDMLNRIRNAQAVAHPTVAVPFSELKHELAKVLVKYGFVEKIEKKGRKTKRILLLTLKYDENKAPAILGMRRISKPGKRVYLDTRHIRPVRGRYGIAILSTPRGLMTGQEARKKKLGGEIICEVW